MKSYTSTAGARLIGELRLLRDHSFAQRCGTILQTVFPNVVPSPSSGTCDRAGIDHCAFTDGTSDLSIVFQCKGFDKPEFGASQLAQCLHSIKAFAESEFACDEYYLIVNQIVRGKDRSTIEAQLEMLTRSKKARTASLLGPEHFLEKVFKQAQRELMRDLQLSVEQFQQQHQHRMDETIYVEEAPFEFNNTERSNNPLKFATERILQLVEQPTNKRSWTAHRVSALTTFSGQFGIRAVFPPSLLHPGREGLILEASQLRKLAPAQSTAFKLIDQLLPSRCGCFYPPQYIGLYDRFSDLNRIHRSSYATTSMTHLTRGARRDAYTSSKIWSHN